MANKYSSYDELPLSLRAEDVASVLGISRANAYTLMHAKSFPTIFIGKRMLELYKEYGKLGQQNRVMKAQFDEFAPKLEELKNSKKEEVQKLKSELKKLEQKIDSTLMEKYIVRRKDKKFPIVFGLDLSKKMNYCPFCATSFSISFFEELSAGNIKECESCHRLIYGFEGK